MSRRLLASLALGAAAVAIPAVGQMRPVTPPVVQPVAPPLHQPSNLELQLQLNQLTEQVQVMADRLGALNQHIASMSGTLGTLSARESQHFAQEHATTYETCRLLYDHHWAPNGATPTPGHPYVPDEYCTAQGWQAQFKD